MNEEERKALAESRGRVANLRAMFNKGAVKNSEPPAWKRRAAPPPPIKLPTAERSKQEKPAESEPAAGDVLRLVRERRESDRKAEEEAKQSHAAVKSSETLVDAAMQERKLREEQERRNAQEARHAMAKQSSYDLESDRAYNHAVQQKEYVRSAELKAKESLAQFTSDGKTFEAEKREEQRRLDELERKKEQDTKDLHATTTYSTEYDHAYNHHLKQREDMTKAEQDAQKSLRNFAGGKTYFEEQLEEKKKMQELEKQKEQLAKEAKSNFSSPDFDHAYVHAKEVAQVEKEAEEKAKAALLKYDQHDVSHEYVMKNGIMVPKSAGNTPNAKRYPFTDPAARIKKPSPQALKALARFQEQLAESRAREERKASDEAARKASWESSRKMSIESVESMGSVRKQSLDEVEIEQIKASVDGAKLDVRSAAQKFADMDRKAAELAKQNKKPLTFNGVAYGHSGRAFRSKDQEQKEAQRKNDMATRIQSRVRGAKAREAYSERVSVAERIAIRIQTEFRRRQAQKQLEDIRQRLHREQACAVVIQKIVRGRSQRNRFQTEVAVRKAAAVLLQSLVRTKQAQAAYTKQTKAAHDIQEFASRILAGRQARQEATDLRKERNAATVIQSAFRNKAAKSQAQSRLDTIIRLQCAWRQAVARRAASQLKAEAEIQAFSQEQLKSNMAVKIQSHWRGSVARSEVATLRAEAAEVDAAKAAEAEAEAAAAAAAAAEEAARQEELVRQEELARQEQEEAVRLEEQARQQAAESNMAVKIQSHWRGSVARSEVATLRAEAAEVDAAKAAEAEAEAAAAAAAAAEEAARQEELVRQEELARQEQEEAVRLEEQARQQAAESNMAVKIQSHWRGSVARSEVATLRAEAAEVDAAKAAEAEAEAAAAAAAAEEAARQEELVRQEELARQEQEEAVRLEEQARQQAAESNMAVKIQSHWRGSVARSEVATLRAEAAEVDAAKAAEAEAEAAAAAAAAAEEAARQEELVRQEELARQEQEEAVRLEEQARQQAAESNMAVKIQSHWRGSVARSEVATLRAEAAEVDAAKAAEAEAEAAAAAAAAAEEAARQEELVRQEELARQEQEEAVRLEEQARQQAAESNMAVKIQSHWRGSVARSEVATLRAEAAEVDAAKAAEAEAEAAAAAAAAEEAARQEELVRQEELARQEQEEAVRLEEQARQQAAESNMAVKIQSHWRGSVARSEVATLRAEAAEVDAAKAAEAEAEAAAAAAAAAEEAARQEELVRQEELARQEQEEAVRLEEQARQQAAESNMAVKIQSHWRGSVARSEVATLRAEAAEVDAAKAAEAEAEAAAAAAAAAEEAARQEELVRQEELARQEQEEAVRLEEQARQQAAESNMAVKIQSHWRGSVARSEVATLRAEAAEVDAAKAAEAEAEAAAAAAAAAEEAARQEELVRQEELARQEQEEAVRLEEQARQQAAESNMAVKIQSHWRGSVARSEVATLRAEAAEVDAAKAAEAEAEAAAAAAAAAEEAARQEELVRQEELARQEQEEAVRLEEQARQQAAESNMAVKIQSHWRGSVARSEVATLRAEAAEVDAAKAAEAEAEAAAAAAAAAEEAARQEELVRQEELARQEQEEAVRLEEQARQQAAESNMAVKIQSHWRGSVARSEVATLRAEAAEVDAAKAAEAEAEAAAAAAAAAEEAARQEELVRQEELARQEQEEAVRLEEQARQQAAESNMAVKIQSHWRGSVARSEVATLRAEAAEVDAAKAAEAEAEAAAAAAAAAEEAARQEELVRQEELARQEQEEAVRLEEQARQQAAESNMAVKIQSHWRGSVARSEVATLRAEAAEVDAAKAAEAEAEAAAAAAAAAEEAARQEELVRQEELARQEQEEAVRLEEQARQQAAESNMAVKIQSHWRGSVARSEVATLRAEAAEVDAAKAAEAEAEAAAAAAAAAEEAARQEELVRQEELARQEQEEAVRLEEQARQQAAESNMAVKIQSHWRGSVARSEVAAIRQNAIADVEAQLARIENLTAVRIQSRWRGVLARLNVARLRFEVARERKDLMAIRLQCQWRSALAARKVKELRAQRTSSAKAQAELENAMALKIQCRWRMSVAEHAFAKRKQAAIEAKNVVLIQAAWRGRAGRAEAAQRRSIAPPNQVELSVERPQVRRQPTLAELQLLSQTGRFSNLSSDSDDSDGDSEFEDAPSFVDAPLAPEVPVSTHSTYMETQAQSPRVAPEDTTRRVSSASVNMGLEFSIPEHHSVMNDDTSDASSDSFVDAMEEHKPIDHDVNNSGVEENHHWASVNNNSTHNTASPAETPAFISDATPSPVKEEILDDVDNEQRPSSSISDFDRPSSVRSGSFFQEPSFDSDTPRGSLASSSLSGVSRPRDESPADPFRSREDSYADSTRSRGDSYADSIRSRNDSYADVFRSRDNSFDDVFRSRGDSYADVPSKTDFDEHNLSDEETHDGPKYFDTDSDRGSSFISDSPVSGQNTSDVEKDKEHEEEQATRKKSGSRWRAASVLSALSSRRSSKPSSSPTSSLEDEEKDLDQKKARSSTLPSVAASGLSSVAGLLNRKLSVPASSTSTKTFEDDIEESFVYSPPAHQAPKSKSRFGRFTAPTVSKPAFPTRFAWKSRGRRGTNDENDEPADTHAA